MTGLAALCGAFAGFGVLLIVAGLKGVEISPASRRSGPPLSERFERFSLRIGLAAVLGLVMAALTGWPVGVGLLALLGFVAPSFFGGRGARQAMIARTEAVASWAEMLRDTMAAAAGIEQAIIATAPVSPPAIRREVTILASRLERESLESALRDFADRMAEPTTDLVVAALLLASKKQARRLGELLGTLATSAREQANMRLKIEAGRARVRTAVKVIVTVTVGFAIGLIVFNGKFLEPYGTPRGQMVLALVGGLFALALYWLVKMSTVGPTERFLVADTIGDEAVVW